ncbi:ABC transporter permease [Glutamicibacter uratoxydans]|uniref:ABC transporter permease n=1 Tax=Glutamicibacter uratoxydans TaxID=43667 RepID=UPI003D6ED3B6
MSTDIKNLPPASQPAQLAVTKASRKRKAKRRPLALTLSVAWLVILFGSIILFPLLPLPDPARSDYAAIGALPFSPGHILGTDEIGRDMLSRLIVGAQVSLTAGIGAILVAVIIGSTLGICAGFFGGWVNRVISGALDIMLAFPSIVALIALSVFMGPGLWTIIIGIGIVASPALARVARSATLTFVNRDFVVAARSMGASSLRILFREILPNVIVPIIAYATVMIAVAIVAEASLSFLGLGVPPPAASWGSMMGTGRAELSTLPHIVLLPAATMFITLLALNFLAEFFSKRFDIKEAAL